MKANNAEIIEVLKEMREACAVCFRVIDRYDLSAELGMELGETIVEDGFGKRCQEMINRLQKGRP